MYLKYKTIIFILFLFLATQGTCETMGTLDSMRIAAFRQMNIPDTGNSVITVARGNTKINIASQQACTDCQALPEFNTLITADVIKLHD